MTTEFFPFDAGAGANVTEAQWRKMARYWVQTGVLVDADTLDHTTLAISERAGGAVMGVDVASGAAWIRGHYFASDAVEQVPVAAADPTDDRIDRIILRADFVANELTIEILEGTPDPAPVAPALEQTAATWEIPLAQILVEAAASSIVDADITDERALVYPPETRRPIQLDFSTDIVDIVNIDSSQLLYEWQLADAPLRVGDELRLLLAGDYLNQSGVSANLDLRILADAQYYSGETASITSLSTRAPWELEFRLLVLPAGALRGLGRFTIGGRVTTAGLGNMSTATPALCDALIATAAVDPTPGLEFEVLRVATQHSAAHASLSIRLKYARLELLPAP